jgi:transposase
VFVGMDSHKDTLAVSGVDATGRQQQTQVFPNPGQGHRRLLGWLQAQPGVVRAVAIHLVQAGLVVVEVTPSLTVRERRRLRQRGKADPTDALAIARVTAREHDLPAVRGQDLTEDLRLLVDYREQLLGERTRIANRRGVPEADRCRHQQFPRDEALRCAVACSRSLAEVSCGLVVRLPSGASQP